MNNLYKIIFIIILFIVSLVAESSTYKTNKKIDIAEKLLFRVTTNDNTVSALWVGVDPNIEFETSDMPLTFGVHKLYFEFSKTKEKLAFHPLGELFFSDWFFNIFSPDYRFLVLLQDHYGPYHIIPIENLADYLAGKNPQFEIVKTSNAKVGAVHKEINWLSIDTIEFTTSCCGGNYTVIHKIGEKTNLSETMILHHTQ